MLSYRIPMVTLSGEKAGDGDVSCETTSNSCGIRLRFRGQEFFESASDYFEALCRLRLLLEPLGYLVAIYGGSRNVYPSRMCRDMGAGLKAYRMRLGAKPDTDDLVDLFQTGPDVQPATVEQQRRFYAEWSSSTATPRKAG
jgi:hypothetical protein